MKRLMIIIVIIIIPFVSGIEELTHQINTNISIRESCHNNGSLCSSAAACNITVFNPKGVNLVDNLAMTQDSSLAFFNYTINDSLTDTIGFYEYDIVCTDGGNTNFGTFNFQVTAGGIDPSLAQVITNAMILFITIFLFAFTVWGFTRLSWKNKTDGEIITVNYMKHVKTIIFVCAYLQLMFIAYMGYSISQQLIFLDFAMPIMRAIFWGLLAFFIPLFAVLWVFTVLFLINDKKMHRALVRGLPFR